MVQTINPINHGSNNVNNCTIVTKKRAVNPLIFLTSQVV